MNGWPLQGLRIVDLSTGIAGGYATKLLADGGAEVVKVEPPGGDPLRRWSASGATIADGDDGALFNFLAASKQSVVGDADGWLADADVAVWSPGGVSSPDELRAAHPHLVVTAVTSFGLDGPWADRPATEFTLQAWSGGIVGLARGTPDRPPVHVGGRIGEWLAGVAAGIGTLAALRRGSPDGELVDVSILEASATGLTYQPVTFHDQLGRPMRKKRFVPTPGVGAARDGLVGLGCGTGQQWLDFCVMVGHPEWMDDPKLFLERSALAPDIDGWIAERTVDEVQAEASSYRIPNAPIVNGASACEVDAFRARGAFVTNPRDGAANPAPPYRLSSAELRPPEPAPGLGEHRGWTIDRSPYPGAGGPEPFSGLRILDMTGFWAGPLAGQIPALLGAEVIHLEAETRPDGARLVGGVPPSDPDHLERGPIFAGLNTNKKSLTVDFSTPEGSETVRRFVATCDVVIENYTPRVLDQAGLDFDSLREVRPDLVMVRMPGFGLDGPWRDKAAFAFVIEDAAGLTWLTGDRDRLPMEPYCVGDPNAGLHAVVGLLLALAHRDRTGEAVLVEAAMVDAALNVAAEQVVEFSAYGALLERAGNRGPVAAPQNLYQAAGPDESGRDDSWVAIAVADDDQWDGLRRALGRPAWADDPALADAAGRRAAHDELDEHLAAWCRTRTADEIVDALWGEGVPVGRVLPGHLQPELPQLAARGFFEELDHPVAGRSRYATLPFRLSNGRERLHTRPAPRLGQHTEELLAELDPVPGH